MDLAQYSRQKSRDLANAMSMALRRHLETLEFPSTQGVLRFKRVFEEWPDFDDKLVLPAACVQHPTDIPYAAARMTPSLVKGTSEPVDDRGRLKEAGFALFATSELDAMFQIQIRAASKPDRRAILGGLEDAWIAFGNSFGKRDPVSRKRQLFRPDSRYGVLLDMPEYYGLTARFALQAQRVIDDPDRAMRNYREATITVNGQARHVVIRPVKPFIVRFRVDQGC